MSAEASENLSADARLALAHSPDEVRDVLRIFLEFDARLARIVAATSEPMLGQMRLAWWRDELGKPVEQRPNGDAVLDGIGEHWAGREAGLISLANAWEHLLAEPPLDEADARKFLEHRRDGLVSVFSAVDSGVADNKAYKDAAWAWVCADVATKVSDSDERAMFVRLGTSDARTGGALPRPARGLAILGALGLRSLRRGGRPLMEGRGAALTALRASVLGR